MRIDIIKKSFGAIALAFLVVSIVGMTPIDTEGRGPSNNGPCTRVGTWHGVVPTPFGDLTYLAVYTPGKDATRGQVFKQTMNSDPTMFGFFPDAVGGTDEFGVWKKGSRDTYQFTWISYAIDAFGNVVYKSRVSGQGEMLDCNNVEYTYTLEYWWNESEDGDINPEDYDHYTCMPGGIAFETRMPLVQIDCYE